jgi:hypothetical protein
VNVDLKLVLYLAAFFFSLIFTIDIIIQLIRDFGTFTKKTYALGATSSFIITKNLKAAKYVRDIFQNSGQFKRIAEATSLKDKLALVFTPLFYKHSLYLFYP